MDDHNRIDTHFGTTFDNNHQILYENILYIAPPYPFIEFVPTSLLHENIPPVKLYPPIIPNNYHHKPDLHKTLLYLLPRSNLAAQQKRSKLYFVKYNKINNKDAQEKLEEIQDETKNNLKLKTEDLENLVKYSVGKNINSL